MHYTCDGTCQGPDGRPTQIVLNVGKYPAGWRTVTIQVRQFAEQEVRSPGDKPDGSEYMHLCPSCTAPNPAVLQETTVRALKLAAEARLKKR